MPIRRLLIANRGEIARRIIATCHRLDVETVAVCSDPDAGLPHTREADLVVRLPGAAPVDTYLRGDLLLAAAAASGADAVHPGYGFLSESAAFAAAVVDAGLVWAGPPPDAIAAMGDKVRAKELMGAADVPLLADLDLATVTDTDLPVLVKAAAGGGGRGMRVVRSRDRLTDEVASARREAAAAFGDDTLFCEPFVERGRHVEVQVLADTHGTVWSLQERECSIQRRHQKIIEETPSPLVDEPLRTRLCGAAERACRAVGYVGAGTVELLATDDGRFWFLEMNTRLQVEHPVTELVHGVDLVAWQLRIAEGAALPPSPPAARGHAVEVRLYAEDPAAGWRPQSGRIERLEFPGVDASFGPLTGAGLRLDAGYGAGDVVSTHYDPMLAKVIAWAPTRSEAVRRLSGVLARARLHGPTTNRDLLVRVLRHPSFVAGETDTAFLDRHGLDALAAPLADERAVQASALVVVLAQAARHEARPPLLAALPSGWRNVPAGLQRAVVRHGERELEVRWRRDRDGLAVEGLDLLDQVLLVGATEGWVVLVLDGVRLVFDVTSDGGDRVWVDSALGPVAVRRVPRFEDPAERVEAGSLLAPMPGMVTAVGVVEGDQVAAGGPVLVLEAMKMEHTVEAPVAGRVERLGVTVGEQVEAGQVLAVVATDDEP